MPTEKPQRKDRRGCPPGGGTVTGVGAGKAGQIGNPPFVPTDQMRSDVRSWGKIANRETIANKLNISVSTLDRHFKEELTDGRFEAIAGIGGKLLEKALAGNLTAQIFYLRTQGKWNTRIEHTGLDGGPISHFDAAAFLAELPLEEQRQMRPILEKMLMAAGVNPDGDDDIADAAS